MATKHCLFITLQYLRTVNGENKYHWGLYCTGSSPPAGHLVHATDVGRAPLDLFPESRRVSNPLKSRTMVVCLKIADSPGMEILERRASSIRLMDRRYLPQGEPRWTCRVWVKEVLVALHESRDIELPSRIDRVERYCLYTADQYIDCMGRAQVFADLSWIPPSRKRRPTPMDIEATEGRSRYYGPSPMVTERYYGPSPMVTERYYGPSPMETERYYGPSPMDTETYYSTVDYR